MITPGTGSLSFSKKQERIIRHIHRIFPGGIAAGKTREETEERIHEAIGMHIRGLIEDGLPIPKSHSSATFVGIQAE